MCCTCFMQPIHPLQYRCTSWGVHPDAEALGRGLKKLKAALLKSALSYLLTGIALCHVQLAAEPQSRGSAPGGEGPAAVSLTQQPAGSQHADASAAPLVRHPPPCFPLSAFFTYLLYVVIASLFRGQGLQPRSSPFCIPHILDVCCDFTP